MPNQLKKFGLSDRAHEFSLRTPVVINSNLQCGKGGEFGTAYDARSLGSLGPGYTQIDDFRPNRPPAGTSEIRSPILSRFETISGWGGLMVGF